MDKLVDWLMNILAPKAQKIFNHPYIAGISSAMTKILPFILAGDIIYIYNVFYNFFPILPDANFLLMFTFRMLGLVTAFMVGHQILEKLELPQYSVIGGVSSVLVFLAFIKPAFDGVATATFDFGRFGPTGMFVSLVAGLMTAAIFHLFASMHILENNDSIPVFIQEWVRNTPFPSSFRSPLRRHWATSPISMSIASSRQSSPRSVPSCSHCLGLFCSRFCRHSSSRLACPRGSGVPSVTPSSQPQSLPISQLWQPDRLLST